MFCQRANLILQNVASRDFKLTSSPAFFECRSETSPDTSMLVSRGRHGGWDYLFYK